MNMQSRAPLAAPTLNQGQQDASDAFFQFLFSDDKEFSISGPAGTGKTTLMSSLIWHVLPEYESTAKILGKKAIPFEISLTATTNKASEVLAQTTGCPVSTIHSFLGLRVVDNYKTGTTELKRTPHWTVHNQKLIFIDEASMIDSKLYQHLMEGTDNTCKIVYLGDHCQMAPVFEEISPVYKNPKHTVFLTQPMRNAGQPALINLCNQLRLTVETGVFQPIVEVPGVIDYLDPAVAEQWINKHYANQSAHQRILAYSNNRVRAYLDHIRDIRGYPDILVEGEAVVNNSGIDVGKRTLRVEEEFTVGKVGSPTEHIVDKNDPNAVLEVYPVSLLDASGAQILVQIPTDLEHYKQLQRHYAKHKNWERYFHLKNLCPDLRQRDAATVYKAQGSTYETVFMDLSNIGSCTNANQLARLLYVGASRATSHLALFGNLPGRIFS